MPDGGAIITGEEPSAQRYALRGVTAPEQWNDTFALLCGNKKGFDAYREATDQTHFGTIYLALNTPNGKKINDLPHAHGDAVSIVQQSPVLPVRRHRRLLLGVDTEGVGTLR
jgi:hypothetical protein